MEAPRGPVLPTRRGSANDHDALTGPPWRATRWEADEAPVTDQRQRHLASGLRFDSVNAGLAGDDRRADSPVRCAGSAP